ncbi:kazal-type serine protease inhibitor domain-containing protein 1-like [Megalops cyprinoides]|uniref:kazal-type serine protease inhibitor domain-containing protein 1-like n=1 Tax=Megalops cyprinoides TaxID=118141 RepID=UPI0018647A1C|nr:kazal-type serine protease inhibitor domain-containing protein 1-like [Megalops cyprinoides]
MAWVGCLLCVCVSLCFHPCLGVPPQHRGWLRLWEEGEGCGECERDRCPPAPPSCPAGLVKDSCGCCEQCGNAEGQPCDPDGAQAFYGHCGEGLRCQRQRRRARVADDPEPKCVCLSQGPVCGSDRRTYPNLCRLQEVANQKDPTLRLAGDGPCYSVPRISRAPKDMINHTGNDIVFSCEVSAFPLPNLSWKKQGSDNFLPGDDPHISVQARGGPERYTVSTWLQIEGLRLSDAGVYSCISHNALGETTASARLTVLRQVKELYDGYLEQEGGYFYDDTEESGDDREPESGDSLE